MADAAADEPDQRLRELDDAAGHAAGIHDGAGQHEEGDREQAEVVQVREQLLRDDQQRRGGGGERQGCGEPDADCNGHTHPDERSAHAEGPHGRNS